MAKLFTQEVVPRKKRHDAFLAGAKLAMRLEDLWLENKIVSEDLVMTIGEFTTDQTHHGITKVPSAQLFTIDIRSENDKVFDRFAAKGCVSRGKFQQFEMSLLTLDLKRVPRQLRCVQLFRMD